MMSHWGLVNRESYFCSVARTPPTLTALVGVSRLEALPRLPAHWAAVVATATATWNLGCQMRSLMKEHRMARTPEKRAPCPARTKWQCRDALRKNRGYPAVCDRGEAGSASVRNRPGGHEVATVVLSLLSRATLLCQTGSVQQIEKTRESSARDRRRLFEATWCQVPISPTALEFPGITRPPDSVRPQLFCLARSPWFRHLVSTAGDG